MTEADWLKAKDPDAMLRLVADRLTPRRWHLLACALARRVGDALPDGPAKAALEWAERHAGHLPDPADRLAAVRASAAAAADAAREAQRAIVRLADPDADPNEFRETADRKTNPSAPLFRSASGHAATAIQLAGEAAEQAVAVVAAVLEMPPGRNLVDRVRGGVVEATRLRASASLHASAALDMKARGDEAADRATSKNVRVQLAAAQDTVTRTDEQIGYRDNDFQEAKEKADRKALGRFLHELAGNPFRPFRFEPTWRTDTAVGLAKAIDADRAFDRMPVLADALLDADCDEEAVLRHCRGTEAHAPDGPAHIRGCWVLELLLEREPELFAGPPLTAPKPPPARRPPPPGPPTGPAFLRLLEAMRGTPPPDDDEDDDKE